MFMGAATAIRATAQEKAGVTHSATFVTDTQILTLEVRFGNTFFKTPNTFLFSKSQPIDLNGIKIVGMVNALIIDITIIKQEQQNREQETENKKKNQSQNKSKKNNKSKNNRQKVKGVRRTTRKEEEQEQEQEQKSGKYRKHNNNNKNLNQKKKSIDYDTAQ